MAQGVRELKRILNGVFQKIIKNMISLGNDSTLESDTKPLKVGEKTSPLELSETELKVTGTINAEAIFVNGSRVQTGEDAGATELNDLSDVSYSSGDLTITSLDKIVADDFEVDSGASIILDAHNGRFIAKNAGTQFSPTNSAYAGMILGYTDIGLDEATASYNLTNSYAVPTSEFNVVFTAPPSGKVEIFIQIQFDCGANAVGDLYAGLSDNATYNTIEDINEELLIDQSGRNGLDTVQHIWTVTGLTGGISYTYYVGFKSSNTTGTPHIQWGGNAANGSPDFIMKATALPVTIAT